MEETNEFMCFDLVSDDSDHHYLSKNVGRNCFSDSKSGVYKRIMREWKILEQNLPKSIYVRAYERRIDLMRAVIVGAAGTPYHDGLFFFDIAFPENYPNKPPKVRFRSFGLRPLNPNFYSNGKVCLSLLNTWNGKKSEMWDPSNSTVLQVLLSIQALVLNEEPFFNETDPLLRLLEAKSARVHYNEHAFALTCHTSLYLIRRPPKNFETFIRAHFRERGSVILSACKAYVNGRVRVGYYGSTSSSTGNDTDTGSRVEVLTNFQKRLEGIYGQLFEAFLQCGASLDPSLENLELQKLINKSDNRGIFKKAWAKIKQALGRKSSKKNQEG